MESWIVGYEDNGSEGLGVLEVRTQDEHQQL